MEKVDQIDLVVVRMVVEQIDLVGVEHRIVVEVIHHKLEVIEQIVIEEQIVIIHIELVVIKDNP